MFQLLTLWQSVNAKNNLPCVVGSNTPATQVRQGAAPQVQPQQWLSAHHY